MGGPKGVAGVTRLRPTSPVPILAAAKKGRPRRPLSPVGAVIGGRLAWRLASRRVVVTVVAPVIADRPYAPTACRLDPFARRGPGQDQLGLPTLRRRPPLACVVLFSALLPVGPVRLAAVQLRRVAGQSPSVPLTLALAALLGAESTSPLGRRVTVRSRLAVAALGGLAPSTPCLAVARKVLPRPPSP